jgi:hypothetical protein
MHHESCLILGLSKDEATSALMLRQARHEGMLAILSPRMRGEDFLFAAAFAAGAAAFPPREQAPRP